ncbi:MAG TPA: glycosyltransferase [Nitrospinaceae bacterium]|nr:glycosyltransferase [Nitrospinaceae bacterium]
MKVSIIIPCYNAEKWVRQCIVSALEQDYDSFEVIAIDNESTDSTNDILFEIKKEYPGLMTGTAPNIYRHSWEEPRGVGLKMCSGDYITFVCSDDYLEKSYLTSCMKFIMSSPKSILALQSPIRNIRNGIPNEQQGHFYKSVEEFKNLALTKSPVNTPTVIYNREIYDKGLLESYPEKYYGAADYDLYCRLADQNIMIYPAPIWTGYNYRWHDEQCTWGMHREPVNYDNLIQDYWREKWKQE